MIGTVKTDKGRADLLQDIYFCKNDSNWILPEITKAFNSRISNGAKTLKGTSKKANPKRDSLFSGHLHGNSP